MTANQTNQFHLFPGTAAQWTDSQKRSDAYHRYVLRQPRAIELGFLNVKSPRVAIAEYAMTIGICPSQLEQTRATF